MIILKKGKKSWQMYVIGSPKGALNTKKRPKFIGILKFIETPKGISINKFIGRCSDEEEKLFPPREAWKLFKKQAVFFVSRDSEMEKFLESNNIKVHFTKICSHCVSEGNITIINSNFTYYYHDQLICKFCAEDTIKRELKLQNYDKKSYKNFKRILDKIKDLNKVLEMINPNFDPLANPNLTLFDKIKVKKVKISEIPINQLKVPKEFKKILNKEKNKNLLPVQYLAIKNGLLKDENLLVVSATASGKTLVGELAGIPKAMKGKKFIFLTPIVALANQKYRDFKKKYEELGLKTSIKIGMNRIKTKEELKIPKSNVSDTDIIVGTYEGIDYLLRSGNSEKLNELGTILIDEIHTLDNEDRGKRLNGMIKRIKNIFPDAQIIGLSATVKNPKQLANEFNMSLLEYNQRPVPLERHIIYVRSETEKKNLISKLILKEFYNKSSKGFPGQTIVFTNSRRKTHQLADYLTRKKIKAAAFHAGLSYFKKEKIEKDFNKGKLSALITTAALATGVDFPTSQVIFETLIMGNKWISPNEFAQMAGRAGRPRYHDKGLIYLIPELANKFNGENEESMTLSLLESNVENINIEYGENDLLEQLLADISSKSLQNIQQIKDFYKNIKIPIEIDKSIDEIHDKKLISINKNKVNPTKYGKAVTISFLTINDAEFIKKSLFKLNIQKKINTKTNNKKESLFSKIINIASKLEYFENAYLSPNLHKQIINKLKTNFSTRLFSDSTLDIISSGETINKLDTKFQETLLKIQIDFLKCECKDKPFCDCLKKQISQFIIKERLNKKDPIEISRKLLIKYHIQTYPSDVFSWLDSFVRNLKAIERISKAYNMKKSAETTEKLIKKIEKGY